MELLSRSLRIGNYIESSFGKIKEVTLCDIMLIEEWERRNDIDEEAPFKMIELNHDLLLKMDFDDSDYKAGYIGKDFTSNMTLQFVLTKPLFMGTWQKEYIFELKEHRIVQIKNLHRLQNCYFEITSQELKFKTK